MLVGRGSVVSLFCKIRALNEIFRVGFAQGVEDVDIIYREVVLFQVVDHGVIGQGSVVLQCFRHIVLDRFIILGYQSDYIVVAIGRIRDDLVDQRAVLCVVARCHHKWSFRRILL